MKTIRISKNKKPLSSGLFGKYFRISKNRGVKVFGKGHRKIETIFSRPKTYLSAQKECELLKKAEKSKISPKFAQLVIVIYRKKFYPAIKMQHFGGDILYNHDRYLKPSYAYVNRFGEIKKNKTIKMKSFILNKLKKAKIVHIDLHSANVMVNSQGKVRVIDFSPEWIKEI